MYDQSAYSEIARFILMLAAVAFFASPICAAIVAQSKGRDAAGWFFLGLVFGPLGLLAAIGVTPIDRQAQRARYGRASTKQICPACDEAVSANAVVCRYCGVDLRAEDDDA